MKELERERIAKKIIFGRENQKKYFTTILDRPTSPLAQIVRVNVEISAIEKETSIQEIKEKLSAADVIEYASKKYKINKEEYEVRKGNKINNFTNAQKPKSVIDFFIKEVNLSPKEAFAECRRLYNLQSSDGEKTDKSNIQEENNEYKSDIALSSETDQNHEFSRKDRDYHDLYKVIDEVTVGLDILAISKVHQDSLGEAFDDKSFFEYIRESFNLKKCEYGSGANSLKLYTKDKKMEEVPLSWLGTSFEEIIEKMAKNDIHLGETEKSKEIRNKRKKRKSPK